MCPETLFVRRKTKWSGGKTQSSIYFVNSNLPVHYGKGKSMLPHIPQYPLVFPLSLSPDLFLLHFFISMHYNITPIWPGKGVRDACELKKKRKKERENAFERGRSKGRGEKERGSGKKRV